MCSITVNPNATGMSNVTMGATTPHYNMPSHKTATQAKITCTLTHRQQNLSLPHLTNKQGSTREYT